MGLRGARGHEPRPVWASHATAWHNDNSQWKTQSLGQKAPEAWGLRDMLGNVREWVQDWYGAYPGGSVTDPQSPGSGRAG